MAENNGTSTKNAAIDGQVAAGRAMTTLYDALASGSADPVEYIQAIGRALKDMQAAHNQFGEIYLNCKVNAVRGSYKK